MKHLPAHLPPPPMPSCLHKPMHLPILPSQPLPVLSPLHLPVPQHAKPIKRGSSKTDLAYKARIQRELEQQQRRMAAELRDLEMRATNREQQAATGRERAAARS